MLNEVRRMLKLFSAYGFDGVIMASNGQGSLELRTFVRCIVLMHYYLHTSMNINIIIRKMMKQYPTAVNKPILKVRNETNAQYDVMLASELSRKIEIVVSSNMASDRDLEEAVDIVMDLYFVPQQPPQ